MNGGAGRIGLWALRIWAWCAFFFLVTPMLIVVPLSFGAGNYIEFPPSGFSLRWYERFFADAAWLEAAWLSIRVAAAATAASLVLGTLLSMAIVREKLPGGAWLEKAVTAPMIVPVVVYSVAVYYLFAGWRFTGNAVAIALAHTVLALPFVVILMSAGLREMDPAQEMAAEGLGAGRWTRMRRIVFPQIAPSLFSAGLLAFVTSFDDLVVALFLSGFQPTLPQKMYENIKIDIDPTISAVSVLQIAVVIVFGVIAILWNEKRAVR